MVPACGLVDMRRSPAADSGGEPPRMRGDVVAVAASASGCASGLEAAAMPHTSFGAESAQMHRAIRSLVLFFADSIARPAKTPKHPLRKHTSPQERPLPTVFAFSPALIFTIALAPQCRTCTMISGNASSRHLSRFLRRPAGVNFDTLRRSGVSRL